MTATPGPIVDRVDRALAAVLGHPAPTERTRQVAIALLDRLADDHVLVTTGDLR